MRVINYISLKMMVAWLCAGLAIAAGGTSQQRLSDEDENIVKAFAWSNTNVIERYIQDGHNINDAIISWPFRAEDKMSAIFFAADEEMIDYLVRKGANPHHLNSKGEMPIDDAYNLEFYDKVSHLAKKYPYASTNTIEGYPVRILEYIFSKYKEKDTVFVSLNMCEPPAGVMSYICRGMPCAEPYAFNFDSNQVTYKGLTNSYNEWKARADKIYGGGKYGTINVLISRISKDEWSFKAGMYKGPLNGFFFSGRYKYIKEYNHWLFIEGEGGVS